MDALERCCARLYELTRIPLALCDSQGNYLAAWPAMSLDTILPQVAAYLPQDFRLQGRDELHPLVLYQEPGFFTGAARLAPDRYCLAGPVGPLSHRRQEVRAVCAPAVQPHRLPDYCTLVLGAPLTTLLQMKVLLCLLVQLVHGQAIDQEAVLFCDNTALRLPSARALEQQLFENREERTAHVPGEFEDALCRAVEQGDARELARRLTLPAQGQNGKMSGDALRQMRYTFIGFLTLVTRAAVRGGLPAETAFSLSDVYCQRMDALDDIERIARLLYNAPMDFCQRVAAVRRDAGRSPLVRQCLAYIAVHLHEPLSLDDLAVHCGVSARTLTARFRREMGATVNGYIQDERIREACYLLRHTAYSLSDIAFFLNFSSQSYFAQVFRRRMGCTPQRYRLRMGRPG